MKIHGKPSDRTKVPKLTDAERHQRFVETAGKVAASERAPDFDRAFAKVALPKSRTAETPEPQRKT